MNQARGPAQVRSCRSGQHQCIVVDLDIVECQDSEKCISSRHCGTDSSDPAFVVDNNAGQIQQQQHAGGVWEDADGRSRVGRDDASVYGVARR